MINIKVLQDSIERERLGLDYMYDNDDQVVLVELLNELNVELGSSFSSLAELDSLRIPNAGKIVAKYISCFSSSSVRSSLLHHMIEDRVENCDLRILQQYLYFKSSSFYLPPPMEQAPAHIYTRFDAAFKKLRPKRLSKELLELARYPRDAFYLPFTLRMLASWKISGMKDLLVMYSSANNISRSDVGLDNNDSTYYPSFEFMSQELRFTGISGLRYFPSSDVTQLLTQYINESNPKIAAAASKTLNKILV